ncbi:MAG: hypothetical protein HQ567_34495, partial [Candidatus Nealsonbacteria bacterium]|nr:hypothetical protein [Candidatus Nealsonbacteria bacterium]
LTTAGTIAETIFGGTTLDVEAVDVGINTQVPTYTGAVDGTALVAPATLAKTGLSDLVMDQPGVNLSQLTIDVQQGRLIGVHGSDPFEEAKLQLGGGTLELAAPADDAAVAFDSALSVTANSTLTGGPGLTGTSGAQVTLGSAANGITLGAGTVLTVQTTNDYALELAGVIAGADATVQVPQGDVTLGGGGNIGSLLVPGGSLEASGDVNVNTLSVQGSGAISTAPGGVSVNDGGTAEIGVTTFATTGGTMSFAGSVLATGADTLILGGGDVIATALSPGPPVAGLSYHRITNDADSGIDSAKTYTHAIDFGTDTTATVNGVVFAADFDGNGDFNNTAEHVGGAGPYLVDTNSAVWSVFDDMDYSGTEVLLTGLTPGETYDLRFYNRAWGVGADRRQTFSYDVDADGSIDNPPGPITFNADDSSADPPAMGNADAAYAMSYVYTAGDTGEIKVGIAAEIAGNTYHFYGLTNEIATGPLETLPADVTLQNLVGTGTINAAAVDVMHTIAPGNDGIGKITVGVAELGMDGGATYNAEISLADVTAVVADQIEVVEGGLLELGGTLAVATLDDRADNSSWSNPKLKVVHNAYGEIGDTLFADVTAGGEPAVEGVVTHIGQGAFLRGVTYTEAPVAEPFATGVELDVFVALGGDADGDEKVWLSDWAALRANFGNTGAGKTWTEGNFDPWVDDKVWLSDWA